MLVVAPLEQSPVLMQRGGARSAKEQSRPQAGAPTSGQAAGARSLAHRCVSWERALHVEPYNETGASQAAISSMLPCAPSLRRGVVFDLAASTTVLLRRVSTT